MIVNVNACDPVPPLASVTVTVNIAVLAVVGVPECSPAAESVNPVGKAPAVTANDNDPTPPVAETDWLYTVPAVPAASGEAVVIAGGFTTVNTKTLGAPIIELVPPAPPPEVLIDVPSIASTAYIETTFSPTSSPDSAAVKGPDPVAAV